MTTNRQLRIFLCHSSADKPAVRDLYEKLTARGIDAWLDEKKLLPGQLWKTEIPKAVREADVVIICLSKTSITKEGYVQKEIKFALDVALEKPAGTIYLIPARLEECKVPDSLSDWHWVNLFDSQGLNLIFKSLEMRAASLEINLRQLALSPISDIILWDKAIKLAREQGHLSHSILQRTFQIGYTRASRIIDLMEDKGIIGPPEGGAQLRRVLDLQGKSIEWTSKSTDYSAPSSGQLPNPAYENKLVLSNGMEFMHVPAGSFIMGSNNSNDKGIPQNTVNIPYSYWTARYPVTNMQYDVYVKTKGIAHPVFDWHSKKDHPVTMVSWNEVIEYCKWLNTLLKAELPSGKVLRLPTEAEWEKAARGVDGREYPWGNTFDKNKCNWDPEKIGDTTPVGTYSPQGDSHYGCADMASNVWEWTHSEDKEYPYIANDGREDEQKGVKRVLRGGAGRCAFRCGSDPDLKADYFFKIFGFRAVVASPLHP
jgi:formylglycine-generating enzyme required for sulfatase activity